MYNTSTPLATGTASYHSLKDLFLKYVKKGIDLGLHQLVKDSVNIYFKDIKKYKESSSNLDSPSDDTTHTKVV